MFLKNHKDCWKFEKYLGNFKIFYNLKKIIINSNVKKFIAGQEGENDNRHTNSLTVPTCC